MLITLEEIKYDTQRPSFWKSKDQKVYDQALELINNMRLRGKVPDTSVEQAICRIVPVARDIIAERALTDVDRN